MKFAAILMLLITLQASRCSSSDEPSTKETRTDVHTREEAAADHAKFVQTADDLLAITRTNLHTLQQKIDSSESAERDELQRVYQYGNKEYNRLLSLLETRKKAAPTDNARQQYAFRNRFLVDLIELNTYLEEVLDQNP